MTPQDFKALLDALRGIQRAIEAKAGSSPEKVVNRFAGVYRELEKLVDECRKRENYFLMGEVKRIRRLYAKIAKEVLNEEN